MWVKYFCHETCKSGTDIVDFIFIFLVFSFLFCSLQMKFSPPHPNAWKILFTVDLYEIPTNRGVCGNVCREILQALKMYEMEKVWYFLSLCFHCFQQKSQGRDKTTCINMKGLNFFLYVLWLCYLQKIWVWRHPLVWKFASWENSNKTQICSSTRNKGVNKKDWHSRITCERRNGLYKRRI